MIWGVMMSKINSIEINEINRKTVTIKYSGQVEGDVKVYCGLTPDDNLETKEFLCTMETNYIEIKEFNKDNRLYYILVLEDGKKYISAARLVDLDGTNNFRDIGGYKTKDGKTVKWGILFRADALSELSNRDIKLLEDMNLKTVIDFRSKSEIKSAKNKCIRNSNTYLLDPNAKIAQLAAGSIDDENKSNRSTLELLKTNEFDPEQYGDPKENMLREYRKFINDEEAKKAYKGVMELVNDAKNFPLVQHCRGGKDRTGFGVAIILLALGVDEKDIIKDYELTSFYRNNRDEIQMNLYKQYTDDKKTLELLKTMQQSKGEYMKEAINEMIRGYGSVDRFLEIVLLIDDKKREKLKADLLY